MQTHTQDVVFSDDDGGKVINESLDLGRGVRVVRSDSETHLRTSTTIDHTAGERGLIFEKGVTFEYVGDDAAVDIAGNGLQLELDKIVSRGKYCIRDLGAGTSYVNGYQLQGASESLWFLDAENFKAGVANNYVNIRWLLCATGDTPYGSN